MGSSLAASGTTFSFGELASGTAYDIAVVTQPSGQRCTVSSGSGTILGADVSSPVVTCTTLATYTISGTGEFEEETPAVGISDGTDTISVTGTEPAVPFSFPPLPSGTAYAITVTQQPTGFTCRVSAGASGTLTTNVTNVVVMCAP
jgi:hypothetical protein